MIDLLEALEHRLSRPGSLTDYVWGETGSRRYLPASRGEVLQAERLLGFTLPDSVRQVYLQVANGGFGPGYGLLGLIRGAMLDTADSVVDLYRSFTLDRPEDPHWSWPPLLLPIAQWEESAFSCVDCSRPEAPVLRFEPADHELGTPWDGHFREEAESFEQWLAGWADGSRAG